MELKKFVELFTAQLEETNPNEITKDTIFKQLDEWSSLTALSIIAMVDEEYNVRIKGDDIRSASTIEDLFQIVENKM